MNNFEETAIVKNSLAQQIKQNAFKERSVYLWDMVDSDMALIVNRTFEKLCKEDVKTQSKPPVILKINTEGGELSACLSIMSAIKSMKKKGYQIHTYGYGSVFSAGLFIYLCGSKKNRFSQEYTRFLLHEPRQFENMGFSTVESKRREFKDLESVWGLLKMVVKENTKIDDKLLDDISINNKDYFFFTPEAKSLGIVDHLF